MYIMENGLPFEWSIIWIIISAILIISSARKVEDIILKENDMTFPLVISCILMIVLTVIDVKYGNPLVSGNGIAPITTTYIPASLFTVIVIIFIKAFTGIGGFLSLGANIFAIAIAGPYLGYKFYKFMNKLPEYHIIAVVFGVIITEISSILVSCMQLAIAYHYPSIIESFVSYVNMYLLNYIQDIVAMLILEVVLTFIILKIMPKLENI